MAQTVREAMTAEPICLSRDTTIIEAAKRMREYNIGDVIIIDHDQICGVLTDRDIVIRALAEGKDANATMVAEICSANVVTVAPDDQIDRAIDLMREHAIRRLPVVQDGHPVGILSIGDLALDRDPRSALADISAASPNR
jgi:CBS domain-containing protein